MRSIPPWKCPPGASAAIGSQASRGARDGRRSVGVARGAHDALTTATTSATNEASFVRSETQTLIHAEEMIDKCTPSDVGPVEVDANVVVESPADTVESTDGVQTVDVVESARATKTTETTETTASFATPLTQPPPPISSFNETSYLLTGMAVMASVLGRMSAQELRYDSARLFRNQESSRALSLELRRKRQEYKEMEEVRLAMDQKRRVVEATEKARQEAERQKKMQEKYEKMALEEEARRKKEVEASRKVYEETQRKLDEEYQERLRKEQEALAEARRIERERREREERDRQEELARLERERMEREEAERRAREEAAAARLQARRDAERDMTKFAVRLEGSIEVSVPPAGTLLPGPMQEEAKFRLTIQTSSLMGGEGLVSQEDFHLLADMAMAAPSIVATAARSGVDNVASALQLQKMRGEGPLMLMEPPEVENWTRLAVTRASVNGLAAISASVLGPAGTTGSISPAAYTFDCRTESGVLPADHPLSYQQTFKNLLDRIIDDPRSQDTVGSFMEVAWESNDAFYEGLMPLDNTHPLLAAKRGLGVCVFLAHFVDRSLYARPARESDAPAWFETCVEFCRNRLNDVYMGSPPDSLTPISSLMSVVLGGSHPIAVELADMAERNTSEQTKFAAAERERARKAILAAKLLEEEWPDEEELRKARAKEREAKTPVTERIWALRNVAASLAIGNPGEVSRARQLLEQAVLLKQDLCDSKEHPAVLPEALMLLKVIRGPREWKDDASGVASLFLKIAMNIGEGFERVGDLCSACIVLELALKETEEAFVSLRNNATLRCVKKLEDLSSELSAEDLAVLTASRRDHERVENYLSNALTDQLGAYQRDGLATRRKHEVWNEDGAKMLGNLGELGKL